MRYIDEQEYKRRRIFYGRLASFSLLAIAILLAYIALFPST